VSKEPFSDGPTGKAGFEAVYRAIDERYDVRNPDLVALVFQCLDHAGVISQQARERFASRVDARVFDQIEIETLKVLNSHGPTARLRISQRLECDDSAQGELGDALAKLKELHRDPQAWSASVDEQLERWVAAELLAVDGGDPTDGLPYTVSPPHLFLSPPQGPSHRTRSLQPRAEGEEGRLDAKYDDEDGGSGER